MKRKPKNIIALFLLLLSFGAVQAQVDDKGVTSTGKEIDCFTITPEDRVVNEYGAIITHPALTRNGKLITRDCYCPFNLGDDNTSITDHVYCTSVKMFAELTYRDPNVRELPQNAHVYVFTDAGYTHCVDTVEPAVIEHPEGTDSITVDITGLSCYTRYYFRLVATNTTECVFDWTDSTRDATLEESTYCTVNSAIALLGGTDRSHEHLVPGSTNQIDSVYDHEGNAYAVVQIGEQCWLKENMRAKTSPSTQHTIVMSNLFYSNYSKCAGYYENNESQYGSRYGVLYNWCAAVDTFYAEGGKPELANENVSSTEWSVTMPAGNRRGICPAGWHVPTNDEWATLAESAGVDTTADGTGLGKLTGSCDWKMYGSGGDSYPGDYLYADRNSTGFTALPAGNWNSTNFYYFGDVAYFWSATPNNSNNEAYRRFMDYDKEYLNSSNIGRYNCFSVRCVRNAQVKNYCDVDLALDNEDGAADGRIDSVKDHQGNWYKVVQIGEQCWLRENMRANVDGSVYPKTVTGADTVTYGRLYTWAAMMNGASSTNYPASGSKVQGICPTGWHVPSDAEWDTLTYYVYNSANPDYKCSGCSSTYWEQSTKCIAKALASTTDWNSSTNTCAVGNTPSSNNATGFSVFPAGGSWDPTQGDFGDFGKGAFFWSATQKDGTYAWYRRMYYNEHTVIRDDDNKNDHISVRCLRDYPIPVSISFHANGGSGTMTAMNVTTMKDTVLKDNSFTHGGNFEFAGWNTKMDGSGTAYTDGGNIVPTESMTLYAQWNSWCDAPSIREQVGSDQSHEHLVAGSTTKIDSVYDHEGNAYAVVQIGDQCWLKENMRATTSPKELLTMKEPTYANSQQPICYDYSSAINTSSRERGILYNWAGAMDTAFSSLPGNKDFQNHRGICPEGWHLPTDAEWMVLEKEYLKQSNGEPITDAQLSSQAKRGVGSGKFTSGCGWAGTANSGTYPNNYSYSERNISGFSVVPAGAYAGTSTKFKEDGFAAYFWSATSYNTQYTWYRGFENDAESVAHYGCERHWGMSVRCVRDYECDIIPETSCNVLQKLSNEHQSATGVIDSVYDHQGNDYAVVQIGDQCWLKENMRCTSSPKGLLSEGKTTNASYQRYCDYSTATQFTLRERGFLYTWAGAMDTAATAANKNYENRRGICPLGWHLPTDAEWTTLFTGLSVGTSSSGNGAGKLTGGCEWNEIGMSTSPNSYTYADRNSSGFTALPIGSCDGSNYTLAGQRAIFWSATSSSSNSQAYDWSLEYDKEYANRTSRNMYHGRSVRCLRNTPTSATISFHANGGTGSMPAMNVMTMKDTVLDALNGITHGGNFVFAGWNTMMDGSGDTYDDGAHITPGESMVLYAQWKTYCNTLFVREQSGSDQSHEHAYDGATDQIDSVYDHEGNRYAVVQIGEQCWLKENMRAKTEPGSNVSIFKNSSAGNSATEPRAYYYDNSETNYAKYGSLYNWLAVMNINTNSTSFTYPHRGICPAGWHVPQQSEWDVMVVAAGCTNASGSGTGVGKLVGGNDWKTYNSTASAAGDYTYSERGSSGFAALPAGQCYSSSFSGITEYAYFWTSTPNGGGQAYRRHIYYQNASVTAASTERQRAQSVRCVRDKFIPEMSVCEDTILGTITLKEVKNAVKIEFINDGTVKKTINNPAATIEINDLAMGSYTVKATSPTREIFEDNACVKHTYTHCTGIANTGTTLAGGKLANHEWSSVTNQIDSVSDHEGNVYRVVQINDQCWLAENMRCTTAPENVVAFTYGGYSSSNYATPRYYTPAGTQTFTIGGAVVDSAQYVERYGIMYNFSAAMTINTLATSFSYPVRGICPQGWHVPQFSELESLMSAFDITGSTGVGVGAGKLAYGCEWTEDNTNETNPGNYADRNSTGFTALPAGAVASGSYDNVGEGAYFWVSTSGSNNTDAYHFRCLYNKSGMYKGTTSRGYAFSVRCVRNN